MNAPLINDLTAPVFAPAETVLECMARPMSVSNFRRIFMLLLRNHYASVANFGQAFAHLSCMRWSADPKRRSVNVDFHRKFDDMRPDDYPAVLVAFGSVDSKRDTIAAFAGHDEFLADTYLQHPTVANLDIWNIHTDEATAYDMAEMVQILCMALSQPICVQTGATSIQCPGFGPPQPEIPAPDAHYAVVTRVQIHYTLPVVRNIESHRLRGWFNEATPDSL